MTPRDLRALRRWGRECTADECRDRRNRSCDLEALGGERGVHDASFGQGALAGRVRGERGVRSRAGRGDARAACADDGSAGDTVTARYPVTMPDGSVRYVTVPENDEEAR
jgi:hypothetical protein